MPKRSVGDIAGYYECLVSIRVGTRSVYSLKVPLWFSLPEGIGSRPLVEARCSSRDSAKEAPMPEVVYPMMAVLCALVVGVPIGTNLGLLQLLWVLASGRLLASREALYADLSDYGLLAWEARWTWAAGAASASGRQLSGRLTHSRPCAGATLSLIPASHLAVAAVKHLSVGQLAAIPRSAPGALAGGDADPRARSRFRPAHQWLRCDGLRAVARLLLGERRARVPRIRRRPPPQFGRRHKRPDRDLEQRAGGIDPS